MLSFWYSKSFINGCGYFCLKDLILGFCLGGFLVLKISGFLGFLGFNI